MGCAACVSCVRTLDVVAAPHKPYKHAPGQHGEASSVTPHVPARCARGTVAGNTGQRAPQARTAKTDKTGKAVQQQTQWRPAATKVAATAGPRADLKPSDVAILQDGSEMQGLRLCPWDEADDDVCSNFGLHHQSDGRCFSDADGPLELSDRQSEALHAWRRMPDLIRKGQGEPAVLEAVPSSKTICQGLVGDCSFLSALSALAEYEQRFQDPVVSGIIHPRATSSTDDGLGDGGPVYNEYGQYACRLFFNGTNRKVVVDDQVPVRRDGKILCAHSARSRELWVTLLEKSFVKIMGRSYNMQGSNPGTDVFHLTGWVPETIPLSRGSGEQSEGFGGRRTCWEDVFAEASEGYHNGRCVVCLGTSELEDAAQDADAQRLGHIEGVSVSTGLVSRHAYPVLDCRQLGQNRLLRLKNPWGRVRWRGRFGPGDAVWREKHDDGRRLAEAVGGADPLKEAAVDDGHFWIEWQDVWRHFSHLYLCWSPAALGLHQVDIHGRWDPHPHFSASSLPDDTHIIAFNPQFLVRFHAPPPADESDTGGATVWALLSRHVRLRSEITTKYVAAHIHRGASRLLCPDAPLEQGIYSNGECALVKLHAEKVNGEQDFVISISQHAQKSVFNFTLQVYTTVPATVTELPPVVPRTWVSGQADGCWHKGTAGGCSNNMWSFFSNPQWRVEVPEGGLDSLYMFLECASEHSVNIRLFPGTAARPESLRTCKTSGAYRQGCCCLKLTGLAPGPYVAVVSTFRPGLIGAYRLAWHSPKSVAVRPHPHPFALALDPPLSISARKVGRGAVARFRLATVEEVRSLVSFRVQTIAKVGLPPTISLLRLSPGHPREEEAPGVESLKENFARSYFAESGCAAVLAAPLEPSVAYELQVFVPESDRADEADLFITSDGQLDVRAQR